MTDLLLMPPGFDDAMALAVKTFWSTRGAGVDSQAGSRGNVIAGKNLDGFLGVVEAVATHRGLPLKSIHTQGRSHLTIPGYYRATKNWDVIITHEKRLLAAIEFKSQVGSLGNNFNNRAEEALGSATDFMAAARAAQFGTLPGQPPPFLGWLMLLEDTPQSNQARGSNSPHFPVLPEFVDASYAERYRILCEKMVGTGLYTRAGLILSEPESGATDGAWRSLSDSTDPKAVFRFLAAHILASLG